MSDYPVINVGSRNSQLALIQTNNVINMLKEINSKIEYKIISMTTQGDKILDTALSKIGEKSLFTKELEQALLHKEVDFVVHSLKDLPTELPEGLVIGAICKRSDPRDALIVKKESPFKTLAELPDGSRIGTSSLRRAAQLKRKYSNLVFSDIRGNLNTRLKKLDESGQYDALILAAAGIERMQWSGRLTQLLDASDCMHAVGQGALAVECRLGDEEILSVLGPLNHVETVLMCTSERAFLRKLEGGCSVPVAVQTKLDEDKLTLDGGIFSIDGTEEVVGTESTNLLAHQKKLERRDHYAAIYVRPEHSAKMKIASQLGIRLAERLIEKGGAAILKKAKDETAMEVAKDKESKSKTI